MEDHIYDGQALLDRLTKGLKRRPQEVVFLVGAPFSAPLAANSPGVPNVEGTIELIRREFADDESELRAFERSLDGPSERRYQKAFVFLQGRRGQAAANEIVRTAVRCARTEGSIDASLQRGDEGCRLLESDTGGWAIGPATDALAQLATQYPERFGRTILTTNFDPLIEVAISRAGGQHFRTTLHSDGSISNTEGSGCHIVHLHGLWYGSDTLHTSKQLIQPRPKLRSSLSQILRDKLVVVSGYGGWDDAFTEAMVNVVRDDLAYPEIIWTFFGDKPNISDGLRGRLNPGVDRGRITMYAGIDCNVFMPTLLNSWQSLEKGRERVSLDLPTPLRLTVPAPVHTAKVVEGKDEDRPPVVSICVGREQELETLRRTDATAIFVTGLGGQGKSTLAARYFETSQHRKSFNFFVWRDCKEESERFETQLAAAAEALSEGRLQQRELSKLPVIDVVRSLVELVGAQRVLFVFDNVDHYVDFEKNTLIGAPNTFVQALLAANASSQVLFTCRPFVEYSALRTITLPLSGISVPAALQLFEARGATAAPASLAEAHDLTDGHAFWLDLLAIQTAKAESPTSLEALLGEIRSGGSAHLPNKMLLSVWDTLREREQVVLRGMAETVKPDTVEEIAVYMRDYLTPKKVRQAISTLRSLNLIVVKQRSGAPDLLELHPLLRQFVRFRFAHGERRSFINAIMEVYRRFCGMHRAEISVRTDLATLRNWTERCELAVAAGHLEEAYTTLDEVASSFRSSAHTREFCRAARLLLENSDWETSHATFPKFERVFRSHAYLLSYLGEHDEVDDLLEKYERTVAEKGIRYARYADMRAHARWLRQDFESAVKWARIANSLGTSGVDVGFDITHMLALAERDAGRPEVALKSFLFGERLETVLDRQELDSGKGGAYYGNIGRCLQFMGQVDGALICLQKSAVLIESNASNDHVINQGYARLWIGEALLAKGVPAKAAQFMLAAAQKWKDVFPHQANRARLLARAVMEKNEAVLEEDDAVAEAASLDWIFGRAN